MYKCFSNVCSPAARSWTPSLTGIAAHAGLQTWRCRSLQCTHQLGNNSAVVPNRGIFLPVHCVILTHVPPADRRVIFRVGAYFSFGIDSAAPSVGHHPRRESHRDLAMKLWEHRRPLCSGRLQRDQLKTRGRTYFFSDERQVCIAVEMSQLSTQPLFDGLAYLWSPTEAKSVVSPMQTFQLQA